MSKTGESRTPGRRARIAGWVCVLGTFLVLALLAWNEGPGLEAGDHAHYLLHARALVEGRPYADTGYIYTDHAWQIGPPAQPPGLPLVLTPLLAFSNENMLVIRLVMLALAAAFVYGVGRYFAVHENYWLGLGVALMLGLSPTVLMASTQVLSDLPFAALVWALINTYDREGPWRAGRVAVATALGAAAFGFRIAGLAIVPAVLVFAFLRYREHGFRPAIPVLVWVGCGLVAAVSGLSLGVVGRLQAVFSEFFTLAPLLLAANLNAYGLAAAEALLYPFPGNIANDVYHLVAILIAGVGLWKWVRASWRSFGVLFAACYGGMLLTIGVREPRYLWPLFPVLVFGLLYGIRALVLRAAPSLKAARREAVSLAVAVVIVLGSVAFRSDGASTGSLATEPTVRQVFDNLQREADAEEIRVAFVKPRVLTWETRIPSMGTFDADPDTVLSVLRAERMTHVVLGDYGLAELRDRGFRVAVERNPQAFVLVMENEEFAVYRFTGAPDGEDADGEER